MPDPSGILFDVLRPNTKRRFGLAALLIAGGALSFGAQAQTAGVSHQAAVQAGVQAAVQAGIQIIDTAQSAQAQTARTHKTIQSGEVAAQSNQSTRSR